MVLKEMGRIDIQNMDITKDSTTNSLVTNMHINTPGDKLFFFFFKSHSV